MKIWKSITHFISDNLKARDASASKNSIKQLKQPTSVISHWYSVDWLTLFQLAKTLMYINSQRYHQHRDDPRLIFLLWLVKFLQPVCRVTKALTFVQHRNISKGYIWDIDISLEGYLENVCWWYLQSKRKAIKILTQGLLHFLQQNLRVNSF